MRAAWSVSGLVGCLLCPAGAIRATASLKSPEANGLPRLDPEGLGNFWLAAQALESSAGVVGVARPWREEGDFDTSAPDDDASPPEMRLHGLPPAGLLHTYCGAGLHFLVGIKALDTLERFAGLCDDGRIRVVRAMLAHGLEFHDDEESSSDALELLSFLSLGLERGDLVDECMLFLSERIARGSASSRVAEAAMVALVRLAADGPGGDSGSLVPVVDALTTVAMNGSDLAASKVVVKSLVQLTKVLASKRCFMALIDSALGSREGRVGAFAARHTGGLAVAMRHVFHNLTCHCIETLRELALHDSNIDVRYQAGFQLKELARKFPADPARLKMQSIAALVDMSVLGRHRNDREFAAGRLQDIAGALGADHADATKESIEALRCMLRWDSDRSVRAHAAQMLAWLAQNMQYENDSSAKLCIEALVDMSTQGEEAADRQLVAQRLTEIGSGSRAMASPTSRQCVRALRRMAVGDPDSSTRARAAELLSELPAEAS